MSRDLAEMDAAKEKQKQVATKKKSTEKSVKRHRDPGVAWILDFNNDGFVSYEESDGADQIIQENPQRLPVFSKDEL
jgi:hypothetical protein